MMQANVIDSAFRSGVKKLLFLGSCCIYLPVGAVHTLENPGKIPLELIEVQVGTFLGEDDIVRFEDRYGSSGTQG